MKEKGRTGGYCKKDRRTPARRINRNGEEGNTEWVENKIRFTYTQ